MSRASPAVPSPLSAVLQHPPAPPPEAARHFAGKLAYETDPADVHADLEAGVGNLVLVDGRSPAAFAREHVPGAVSVPHRTISAESTAGWDRSLVYVTYCDGPGCNGSTRAAARLAALGFTVKEMIGGLEWWKRDGYRVAAGAPATTAQPPAPACGC